MLASLAISPLSVTLCRVFYLDFYLLEEIAHGHGWTATKNCNKKKLVGKSTIQLEMFGGHAMLGNKVLPAVLISFIVMCLLSRETLAPHTHPFIESWYIL